MKIGESKIGFDNWFWCESNAAEYDRVYLKRNEVCLLKNTTVVHRFFLSPIINLELHTLKANKQLGKLSVHLRELARNDYALFLSRESCSI